MTAYSKIGIVNMALSRIGQPKIDSLSESSTAADQANLVYDYIRDEVLEAADWVFAKTRVALNQNATTPVQGYDYAYTLPADFLRVVQDRKDDHAVYPHSSVPESYLFGEFDVRGRIYDYRIEALADGTLCLFTNYDNSTEALVLQYIRREENPARYSALFISALAYRLGEELAPVLTGSQTKADAQRDRYAFTLRQAIGHNRSGDKLRDETGSEDWIGAGR